MARIVAPSGSPTRPAPNAPNASIISVPFDFDVETDNGGVAVATGDVIAIGKLAAGHVVVDASLDTDAFAAGVVDVGLEEPGGTNAELMTGVDVGTAAFIRADVAGLSRLTADAAVDRTIAVKFTTGSAAVTGKMRLNVFVRAAHYHDDY